MGHLGYFDYIYIYNKWVNGWFWVLVYIIGLDWIWVIPTLPITHLLNWYKWVIGFLIPNLFKTQPNPPKSTHLPPEKIEKIEENVWKKIEGKEKTKDTVKEEENKKELKEYKNKKKKK